SNGAGGGDVTRETLTVAEMLERLRLFKAQAEAAYTRMYEARIGSDLAGCYSDAKESLHEAIALAQRLGLWRGRAAVGSAGGDQDGVSPAVSWLEPPFRRFSTPPSRLRATADQSSRALRLSTGWRQPGAISMSGLSTNGRSWASGCGRTRGRVPARAKSPLPSRQCLMSPL